MQSLLNGCPDREVSCYLQIEMIYAQVQSIQA